MLIYVSQGSASESDGDAVGFAADFGFDFADAKLDAPEEPAEVSAGPSKSALLEQRIEEVRKEREALLELPEADPLLGEESDDDSVEIQVDSDLEDADEASESFFDDSVDVQADAEATQTFAELNLSKPVLKALGALGYQKPTPIQSVAIPAALAGKDICGGAVTGSGKTAAFVVPIVERLLHRPRRGPAVSRVLVLLPTRELCVQCHAVAQSIARFTDIRVALIAGGLPMRAQEAELRARPDVVVATPGRLIDHLANTPGFSLDGLEILVLDEADRMLEEGFADELDEIMRHTPRQRQTMLFSATMTDKIDDLIRLSLRHPVRLFVDASDSIAKRLVQEFVRIRKDRDDDRLPIILALCKRTVTERAIVFMPTKELAHRMRILLGLIGLSVVELHGGLAQTDRLESLRKFTAGEADFLVATDVAARGLDIPTVQAVINYSMPPNYKQYVHRIGRTARAGRSGRSITLVGEGADRKQLRLILKNAAEPMKHRIVAKATIAEYRRIIDDLEPDVQELMEVEKQDRLLEKAQSEVGRAENLLKHAADIKARPAKAWFQSSKQKLAAKRRDTRVSKAE
jgi:ATP-dependent RNA helicase DDX27